MDATSPRLRFKHRFRHEIVPPDGVVLLSEQGQILLRGRAFVHLAPLLTGEYTIEDLFTQCMGNHTGSEMFSALCQLQQKGYLVEVSSTLSSEQAAFWEMLGVEATEAAARLQAATVSIASLGPIDPEPLRIALTSLGIRVDDRGAYQMVLSDDYLRDDLEAFNKDALIRTQPWMLVKPVGAELWIGPLFEPGETACWECLAHRLRGARKTESYLHERQIGVPNYAPLSVAALPPTRQIAFHIAATEMAKWIVCGQDASLAGRMMSLDMLSLATHPHILVRRPQCPACGDPQWVAARQAARLSLQSRQKRFTTDGGHRSCSPAETYRKLAHHISPITGVASVLRPVSTWVDEHRLISSYVTGHNFADATMDGVPDPDFLQTSLQTRQS